MRIKLNENKVIKFNIDNIVGSSMDNLKGYFRFIFEDIEYGFPAEFNNNSISVKIPAFKNILNGKLMESLSKHSEVRVKGRMDIIANNDTYVCPWMGDVDIEIPVSIKIQENEDKKENKINIKDVMENIEKENKNKESKFKSRFSIMLKEKKCPEGEKW
jgi:hypothetical protein